MTPTRNRQLRAEGEPNPFESLVLIACVIQGWLVLTGLAQPSSIQAALGSTLRIMWASLLLFGGVTAVAGLHWPLDLMTGFEVKRVGLFACGSAGLAYGVAMVFLGPTAWVAAVLQLVFSASCFIRIYQITRRIRKVRSQLVAARQED